MSPHLSNGLLEAFVAGELGEAMCIVVANHLDECASCTGRVASMDNLGQLIAMDPEPVMPLDLVHDIVAATQAELEPQSGRSAFVVAAALMAASTLLTLGALDLSALLVDFSATLHVLLRVATSGGMAPVWLTTLGVGALAAFAVAWTSLQQPARVRSM